MLEKTAMLCRWSARILGALLVLLFAAIAMGERLPVLAELGAQERMIFLAWAAILSGLILAWKKEGSGSLLTLAGAGLIIGLNSASLRMWPVQLCAATAVVHAACWVVLHDKPSAIVPPKIFWAAGALLLLLPANEIFMNPPLMTAAFSPPESMVGSWRQMHAGGDDLMFTIREDGTVTGTFAGNSFMDATIVYNRSWFGKLMHWRSEYIIIGKNFTAPLHWKGEALQGALFERGKGPRHFALQPM